MLGLSKGCVLIFNTMIMTQVYCRFTVHREAIKIIKYLPKTKCFISLCSEGYLNIWQVGQDHKIHMIKSRKLGTEKPISMIHVVSTDTLSQQTHHSNEEETNPSGAIAGGASVSAAGNKQGHFDKSKSFFQKQKTVTPF